MLYILAREFVWCDYVFIFGLATVNSTNKPEGHQGRQYWWRLLTGMHDMHIR